MSTLLRFAVSSWLTLGFAMSGCVGAARDLDNWEDEGTEVDEGAARGRRRFDAGSRFDAGTVRDAGSTLDAGTAIDAGTVRDAGSTFDAGTTRDAGSALDAGADTTPPTVRITSPTANQSVTGTVTISATASDNVAVTSLRLRVDGVMQGTQLTAPPFTWSWNTGNAVDGLHSLSVVASDAAGNSASAVVEVTVSNTPVSALYVSTTGVDTGTCRSSAAPCRTIGYGVSRMSAGDTLIVGNGTYTEQNPIRHVPSGNAGPDRIAGTADDVYTKVRAQTDFGVLIDGSAWPNTWVYGIRFDGLSFIEVRGFRVHANSRNNTGGPATADGDHIKFIRCGFAYAGVMENTANLALGGDHMLVEECYAFGGGRYQFLNYWGTNNVFRRNVARNDYWSSSLQSAAFTNYDSVGTVWQNNIAIDSDESCCAGHLYAGFFNENKTDHADDTSQTFTGNLVLNYKVFYAAHLDWVVSGTRTLSDNIYWDSNGGYWGDQGPGAPASFTATNLTSGAMSQTYDGANDGAARGTGMSILHDLPNTVRSSLFVNNHSLGVADYLNGDYNAFSGNGANYGGLHRATPGAHDLTSHSAIYSPSTNPGGSVKYLPRGAEPGSVLATSGQDGARAGAQMLWKIGVDGTLKGEPGWDIVRSAANGYGGVDDRLWPFPNEAVVKADLASYAGPGLQGKRGFCTTGKQLDGVNDVTLTSYIWEYLGNPMPATLY